VFKIIAGNVEGLPQFGYLMLCQPSDDVIKKRKFDDNEKTIAKRSHPWPMIGSDMMLKLFGHAQIAANPCWAQPFKMQ